MKADSRAEPMVLRMEWSCADERALKWENSRADTKAANWVGSKGPPMVEQKVNPRVELRAASKVLLSDSPKAATKEHQWVH